MKMNRPLVLLTIGFVLSLMLLSTVSGSTSVEQNFFLCNQGNLAGSSGQVQINVCNKYGSSQGSVQYEVKSSNYVSLATGGCNGGPCSNPTVGGVNANSYLILRFYPNYISGIQIFQPDSNGNIQQVWIPYSYSYYGYNYYGYGLNCNPYYQVCYTQSQNYCNYSQSCSAVMFRIAATPLTVNVFFNL